jgi:4-amino-4-deoxy-L-arabinose transferase-like glycosyltransferase
MTAMSTAATETSPMPPATDPARSRHPGPIQWWEIAGLVAAVVSFLILALILIKQGVPLGHDEAVYSARARELLHGDPASSWWRPYRAPGLPALLTMAWIGNGTEPYLRLVVALTGGLLIVATWYMGRIMIGRSTALFAAFGLAMTPVILTSSTQVWPDVPGAAFGMLALAVYARALLTERFGWWAVLAVPALTAAATTIRYGAPIPLAVGLIGLTLWGGRQARRHVRRIAATAAGVAATVVVLLMTPVLTGSQTPFAADRALTSTIPLTQGFTDFWHLHDFLLAGPVVIGFLGIAAGMGRASTSRTQSARILWPLGIGAATFATLAASIHGEPRYLAPVYPWFWLAAGAGIALVARSLPRTLMMGSALAVFLVVFALGVPLSNGQNQFNEGFTVIKEAASSLDTGQPCGVFTSYTPQVEWYSGCEAVAFNRKEAVTGSPEFPEGRRYLFVVEEGKRQPSDEILEDYEEAATGPARTFGIPGVRRRYVEVWTISGG